MCKELSSAKGIVYRIQCLVSDKSYVGQTGKHLSFFDRYSVKRSLQDKTQIELLEYFKRGKTNRFGSELRRDVEAYPPDQFRVTILAKEIKKDKERDSLEAEFIKKYKTLEKGYNTMKNSSFARRELNSPYSIVDLRTMKELKGSDLNAFVKSIITEIRPTHRSGKEKENAFKVTRSLLSTLPVSFRTNLRTGRWNWHTSIENFSIYGYASSWWLKSGVPDNMEVVPHEYDTISGKMTLPLLKIKEGYLVEHGRGKAFNPEPFIFSIDPIEHQKQKEIIKNELSEWISNEALSYAEKLAEKYKFILNTPIGPGGVDSYLNLIVEDGGRNSSHAHPQLGGRDRKKYKREV